MSYSERPPRNDESTLFMVSGDQLRPLITRAKKAITEQDKPVMFRRDLYWLPPGWRPPSRKKKISDIIPPMSPGVFWIPPGWIPPEDDDDKQREAEEEKPEPVIIIDEKQLMTGQQVNPIEQQASLNLRNGGYLCILSGAEDGYIWMPNTSKRT